MNKLLCFLGFHCWHYLPKSVTKEGNKKHCFSNKKKVAFLQCCRCDKFDWYYSQY